MTEIAQIWPKSGREVEEKNPLPLSETTINNWSLSDFVEVEEKIKPEGSKKKVTVQKTLHYKYEEVKQVKDLISFK